MTAVVFETPGLIDMRAFTVMGAHAKPNTDHPIGYFGTGLKYALATILREGGEVVAFVGRDRFRFSRNPGTFRGSPLETVKMSRLKDGNSRETSYELPFTTAMGKNWKPWMAYRELASNTFDENGLIWTDDDAGDDGDWYGDVGWLNGNEGRTRIVVVLDSFLGAYIGRDEVFLKDGLRSGKGVQVIPGESDKLWWRGMRVLDLPCPSLFTYNLLDPIELTEDRTLKYEHQARRAIAAWVVGEATADQAEAILKAKEGTWEQVLDFPGWAMPAPSQAFKEVLTERRGSPKADHVPIPSGPRFSGAISRTAWAFFAPHAKASRPPKPKAPEKPWKLTEEHPRPWRVEGLEVLDKAGSAVFAAPEGYYDDWERTAQAIVARVNVGLGTTPPAPRAEGGQGVVAEVDEAVSHRLGTCGEGCGICAEEADDAENEAAQAAEDEDDGEIPF
jgi:hypothetical protein